MVESHSRARRTRRSANAKSIQDNLAGAFTVRHCGNRGLAARVCRNTQIDGGRHPSSGPGRDGLADRSAEPITSLSHYA